MAMTSCALCSTSAVRYTRPLPHLLLTTQTAKPLANCATSSTRGPDNCAALAPSSTKGEETYHGTSFV